MEEMEVPSCFLCPISLQIMKDPVSTATSATYDRQSIERWLLVDRRRTCPTTNQALPPASELTPNHTLRRLISAWFAGGESRRRCLFESLAATIIGSSRKNQENMAEQALSILLSLVAEPEELKPLVEFNNHELVHSLAWLLCAKATTQAIIAMSMVLEVGGRSSVERLKPEFFPPVVGFLRARRSSTETKAALKVLLAAGEYGANRGTMVEAGAVVELVELELAAPPCRRTTELALAVLEKLCLCAEGRSELLRHPAAIAVVGKRLLRVSPAADDTALRILYQVCKFSGRKEVVEEMLRVGAVAKVFMVLQADCSTAAKVKAKWILGLHPAAWSSSPCSAVYALTGYSLF